MKLLVTGGSGFIGKPLLRRLVDDGHTVHALSRKADAFKDIVGVIAHQGDVTDQASCVAFAEREKTLDGVIHLAALVTYYGPWKWFEQANVVGTENVLDLASRTGAPRFIYGSSVEAVGPCATSEVPSTASSLCRPISPYGESKVVAEGLVREWAKSASRAARILRIGNVYGPTQNNFVIEFSEALITHGPIAEFRRVFGQRLLQPAYLDDVVEGILHALVATTVGTATATIAGPWMTIDAILELCALAANTVVPERDWHWHDVLYLLARQKYHRWKGSIDTLTYLVAPPLTRPHRASSLDEAQRFFGWQPKVSIAEGVSRTVAWARTQHLLSEVF